MTKTKTKHSKKKDNSISNLFIPKSSNKKTYGGNDTITFLEKMDKIKVRKTDEAGPFLKNLG